MTNVLITGGTGFIGSNLVEACLKEGFSVRVFVLSDDPNLSILQNKEVEIFYGNIKNYEDLEMACEGMDKVFHCAGIVTDYAPKSLYHDVNVKGMENLCKAAMKKSVKRLVYMSTCDVFGDREDVIIDETCSLKKWGEPYADTKIEAEKIAWRYYHKYNLPISMVYGCWVYGERDFTFTALLADAITKNELIFWRKDVHVWLNYVKNLTQFLILLSQDDRAIGKGYFLHDGKMITLQNYCRKIADTLDIPFKERYIPYWLAMAAAWIMEKTSRLFRRKKRPLLTTYIVKNLGSRFNFSIQKAVTELDWKPRYSFEEGMTKTMEWLKSVDFDQLKQK